METICLPISSRFQSSLDRYNKYNYVNYPTNSFQEPQASSRVLEAPALNSLSLMSEDGKEYLAKMITNRKSKTGNKRGLNIGVRVQVPTTVAAVKNGDSLEILVDKIAEDLQERLEGKAFNVSECPSCDEEEATVSPLRLTVKPAYKCDEWDPKNRVCILERNIGDTVTFYITTDSVRRSHKTNVTWRKEFHLRNTKYREGIIISAENSTENIIIGRQGYELRVSPITEMDLGYNMFSATLQGHSSYRSKVFFMIRVVPIDLGFVYVGETIELNLRSFVSLPIESMTFKWYMEKDGEDGTLPSNMRVSTTRSSIKISELRQEQEGILACSVYTNRNFLATKKRFLIKDLIKNNDVLKSAPDHKLNFEEDTEREKRGSMLQFFNRNLHKTKRDPKSSLFRENFDREKRDPELPFFSNHMKRKKDLKLHARNRREDIEEEIERALLETTTTEKEIIDIASYITTTRNLADYDLDMDLSQEAEKNTETQMSQDNSNMFQDINQGVNEDIEIPQGKEVDIEIENEPMEAEETKFSPPSPSNNLAELNENVENFRTKSTASVINPPRIIPEISKNVRPQPILNNLQPFIPTEKQADRVQSFDIGAKNGKGMNNLQEDESEVILNIDKYTRAKKLTAEEKISKMISTCYSDIECSSSAICVRSSLKVHGYCRCLPGSNGVGIFCREFTWMDNDDFNMDDLHNPDDVP